MATTITHSYGKLSSKQLQEFERRTGFVLPDSYRRFLLASNGGRPKPYVYDVPNWPGGRSDVHILYGIHSGKDGNLENWCDELRGQLPEAFIPIGIDTGGNFLLLGTIDRYIGEIFYWDSSPDWNLGPETGTMFKVADDIDAFLKGLHDE